MRTARNTMIAMLAAAGLALATTAYAFPPGAGPAGGPCIQGGGPGMGYGAGPGMGYGGGPRGGMMGWGGGPRAGYGPGTTANAGAFVDSRLAFLKGTLGITADQESAWSAYATQARQQAEAMVALRSQAAATAQSAPDRIAQRAEFMKQRAANAQSMSAAVKDLYAALTPEQKTLADQYLGGGARFAGAGPRGWR
jgi:Spy/CpxP family protein refolding chaperone